MEKFDELDLDDLLEALDDFKKNHIKKYDHTLYCIENEIDEKNSNIWIEINKIHRIIKSDFNELNEQYNDLVKKKIMEIMDMHARQNLVESNIIVLEKKLDAIAVMLDEQSKRVDIIGSNPLHILDKSLEEKIKDNISKNIIKTEEKFEKKLSEIADISFRAKQTFYDLDTRIPTLVSVTADYNSYKKSFYDIQCRLSKIEMDLLEKKDG